MKQKIFMAKEWISGDTCVFTIDNLIERMYVKREITIMRANFIKKLMDEGYEIITDYNLIDKDTICFTMDDYAICGDDKSMSEYKKLFDEKIFLAGGDKLNYPVSKSVTDYFKEPFLPSVFKNEFVNGGEDKILIETMDQVDILNRYYEDNKNNKSIMDKLSGCIFQQYIETPTNYKTYIRVLMSASGEMMGASLKFKDSVSKKELVGYFENVFLDSNSKYFINSNKMFGYYSGGDEINFNQPSYSGKKKSILREHNIDINDVKVPDEVLEVSKNIVTKLNRELGVICGIDFIMDKTTGKWYYLENQAFPAVDEWAKNNGYTIPKQTSINTYLEYLKIELDCRYVSLNMLLEKKKQKKLEKKI